MCDFYGRSTHWRASLYARGRVSVATALIINFIAVAALLLSLGGAYVSQMTLSSS